MSWRFNPELCLSCKKKSKTVGVYVTRSKIVPIVHILLLAMSVTKSPTVSALKDPAVQLSPHPVLHHIRGEVNDVSPIYNSRVGSLVRIRCGLRSNNAQDLVLNVTLQDPSQRSVASRIPECIFNYVAFSLNIALRCYSKLNNYGDVNLRFISNVTTICLLRKLNFRSREVVKNPEADFANVVVVNLDVAIIYFEPKGSRWDPPFPSPCVVDNNRRSPLILSIASFKQLAGDLCISDDQVASILRQVVYHAARAIELGSAVVFSF
jgi:hypothetical protein